MRLIVDGSSPSVTYTENLPNFYLMELINDVVIDQCLTITECENAGSH